MEPFGHFAVSLYNRKRPQPSQRLVSISTSPSRHLLLPILTKTEIPITIRGPVEADEFVKVEIEPADELCRGQLTIDAPELLNGLTWCIQLPRRRALNRGLTLAISTPGLVSQITVHYTAPTNTHTALLHIAMPDPPEIKRIGIITYEVGINQPPVLTEMPLENPQAQLLVMARAFAFAGAYSRFVAAALNTEASAPANNE